jgi:hypothetical protein
MQRFQAAGVANRVHMVGYLSMEDYRCLLRRSTLHTYFTRPYVLSWSLLQAMACGCAIVASDVAPVRELIRHGCHGLLVDHSSPDLPSRLASALSAPGWEERRLAARRRIQRNFTVSQSLNSYNNLLFG